MKKSVKIIAALCLMAALVLSLAACGDKKDELVGTWECNYYNIMVDGLIKRGITEAEAKEMSMDYFDAKVILVLHEDNTAYFIHMLDDRISGDVVVWQMDGKNLLLIDKDSYKENDFSYAIHVTVGDDTLSIADENYDDDLLYVFKKK